MYKLIIADDEKIILEGLAGLVDWRNLGFELVSVFRDGGEVLEFLDSEPVDVVLTDIKMAHISGIDIARYVHETELPCKVVFISGHREFELALQAIKYGVEDYILKPSEAEEVQEVFRKVRKELDAKAKDSAFRKKAEQHWEEMYPVLTEKFVSNLIMGAVDDRVEVERKMQLLYPGIDAELCPCILATIMINDLEVFLQERWSYSTEQFNEAIYNFVGIYQEAGFFHVIYKYKGKVRLFAIMKESQDTEEENVAFCTNCTKQLVAKMEEIFGLDISLDIERIYRNIYEIVDKRDEIIRMHIGREELHLQEQEKLLMSNIVSGNINIAKKIMKNILQHLSGEDIHYRSQLVVDILSGIFNLFRENSPQLYQNLQPYINYRSILNMNTSAELEVYCNRIFDKMKTQNGMSGEINGNGLVDRAKKYVEEHIYEDIMLEELANLVFISNRHLNRIFKKQMGETFQRYVTRRKMEKAAELLRDPQYRVYQVGEQLGYKTPRYFSKLFYSFFGYYPNEYRKEVLKLGEVADDEA